MEEKGGMGGTDVEKKMQMIIVWVFTHVDFVFNENIDNFNEIIVTVLTFERGCQR